jgi:1-acyl-sn-glycerol-3-phosphate acyltransferase
MVKKQIINPSKEDFSKPAVVIANHQSFLDILSIIMLRPKLIFLTNEWVWNSPVMGQIVRLADFYSVDGEENIEDKIDFFKSKIAEGYSIVIFPEGTRSEDGTIKRFHKGAFYLAETLQLDILPVLLHGTGMCMNKKDYMLSKGTITVHILPRIAFDTAKTYQEKAKECTKLLRVEYQRQTKPSFFYYQLIQQYLYKGPVLEWYTRIKVGLENCYELFDQHLPSNGKIYDLGCGYGFLAQTLTWTKPSREFIGIDYDTSKIEVAKNIKKQANGFPQFHASDVLEFELVPCEGIVLADMLHYLSPTDQEVLITNCIDALKPGGVFLLRDGDASLATKQHERTKLSEFFSTKLLGFNKTGVENLSFIDFTVLIEKLKQYENIQIERIEESKKTSNTVLKITKKEVKD